ncbi:glucokinase [Kordiimonas pumila]|uniref:Glucokinase n=1 Tax=Kordiimonas pumila TaxID=2161677 RepID=A0ABV7D8S7_9PROT|nr:glucokinase [Kordiimonas pumila]
MAAKQPTHTSSVLVADIGGTNARLAVAVCSSAESKPILLYYKTYTCAEFSNFSSILHTYLSTLEGDIPTEACLAVAGPVSKGKAHITNIGWHLDQAALKHEFGLVELLLANDFEALARSAPALNMEDVTVLYKGSDNPVGAISIMGPGTGFGSAILVKHDHNYTVVPTEAGHMSFIPLGKDAVDVWAEVSKTIGRVTTETLLCGAGITRIYKAICALENVAPKEYDPKTISIQALENKDSICLKTLSVFCSMLGDAAGDIALAQGATGGVYLGGGILPQIADFIVTSQFTNHFLNKAPMENMLAKIPAYMITEKDAALYGAALLSQTPTTTS